MKEIIRYLNARRASSFAGKAYIVFVAPENKPVLIRDRLRKLFYLDYLICQRHDNKLPWWTTPTKPLVYMLAPLARTVSGASENENDVYNNDWQRRPSRNS